MTINGMYAQSLMASESTYSRFAYTLLINGSYDGVGHRCRFCGDLQLYCILKIFDDKQPKKSLLYRHESVQPPSFGTGNLTKRIIILHNNAVITRGIFWFRIILSILCACTQACLELQRLSLTYHYCSLFLLTSVRGNLEFTGYLLLFVFCRSVQVCVFCTLAFDTRVVPLDLRFGMLHRRSFNNIIIIIFADENSIWRVSLACLNKVCEQGYFVCLRSTCQKNVLSSFLRLLLRVCTWLQSD